MFFYNIKNAINKNLWNIIIIVAFVYWWLLYKILKEGLWNIFFTVKFESKSKKIYV